MRILAALASILICSSLQSAHACDAKVLTKRIKQVAKPDASKGAWTPAFVHFSNKFFSEEELRVADLLRRYGSEAIPHLLPLLQDENPAVRNLAYYTLADIDGWTEEHLAMLVQCRRSGDDWIPLAIAKIGTAEAANFLVEELVRTRETQTPLRAAVMNAGERAVPPLLRVYQSEDRWDPMLESMMYFIFKGLNDKAVGAIEPLLAIAADKAEPDAKRLRAVTALGAIGPSALLQLVQGENNFFTAGSSMANAGDPDTTVLLMRDIAALGARGKPAGPLVVNFLSSDDWDVRVAAARTLGRIGHTESAGELIKLLPRPDDWRLVFRAAESLGAFKTEEAIPVLAELSRSHWYPPVREAALQAIKAIGNQGEFKPTANDDDDFFADKVGAATEWLNEKDAGKLQIAALPRPKLLRIKIKGDDSVHRTEERLGIQVGEGYLVGTDNGEWGGEIAFVDANGNSRRLAPDNTEAIYQTADGILAVTGLAHLSFNSGFICKILKGADQQWRVEKWRRLPGAPRFSRLLKDGSVFVSCFGGIVVVAPDGNMKSMTRSECLHISAR